MHPPSRRNRTIGLIGLVWLTYCTWVTWRVLHDPHAFREEFSEYTWTDQELAIGAGCYFLAGLAGLVLVVTRLIMPLFHRRALIGYDVAHPLMVIDVVPQFEDFYALGAITKAKATQMKLIGMVFAGLVFFVMLEHPSLRHAGVPLQEIVGFFVALLLARVVFVVIRSWVARTRTWLSMRWTMSSRHREPRRYHLFEDGLIVQGLTFQKDVPWYDVRQAHLAGNTIGFIGRGELMVIPGEALASQSSADQLMDLLLRKKLLVKPTPA